MTQNPEPVGAAGRLPRSHPRVTPQQPGYRPPAQGGTPPQPGGFPPQQVVTPRRAATLRRPVTRRHPAAGSLRPVLRSAGRDPPQGGGYAAAPAAPRHPEEEPGLIIGIVVAAVVLLAAIGGIIMALSGGSDEPVSTITPSAPHHAHRRRRRPNRRPNRRRARPTVGPRPSTTTPTDNPTQAPAGKAIDLGNGVSLTPAAGWQVRSQQKGAAQLANGRDIFVGIVASCRPTATRVRPATRTTATSPRSTRTASSRIAKKADLGTKKLSAATCQAQVTVTNGGNAIRCDLLAGVGPHRRPDRVGTAYFTEDSDTTQLNKDYSAMVNSMLPGCQRCNRRGRERHRERTDEAIAP